MAEDASNSIIWLLELPRAHSEWLAGIRHWDHLKIANEGDSMWVGGFSNAEIESVAVKSIPGKKIWHQRDNRLFPQGSRLPFRTAPALLWTPIGRGLPLTLPAENHNLFSSGTPAPVRLSRSDAVHEAVAMTTTLKALGTFLENAAAVRLKSLRWTIFGGNSALVLGTPLLPVPGNAFWQRGNFLVPAGYDFEWPVIAGILQNKISLADSETIVWSTAGKWVRIPATAFRPLTIGSYRQSALLIGAKTDHTL